LPTFLQSQILPLIATNATCRDSILAVVNVIKKKQAVFMDAGSDIARVCSAKQHSANYVESAFLTDFINIVRKLHVTCVKGNLTSANVVGPTIIDIVESLNAPLDAKLMVATVIFTPLENAILIGKCACLFAHAHAFRGIALVFATADKKEPEIKELWSGEMKTNYTSINQSFSCASFLLTTFNVSTFFKSKVL